MAEKAPGLFARISVNYEDDPAVAALTSNAELLFLRSIVYSKRINSDGEIRRKILPRLATKIPDDPAALVAELIEEGLWITDDDGWTMPAFSRWQTTESEQDEIREKRRLAGLARAHQRGSHAESPHSDCPRCLSTSSSTCSAHAQAHAGKKRAHNPAEIEVEVEVEVEETTSPLVTKEGPVDKSARGVEALMPANIPADSKTTAARILEKLNPPGGAKADDIATLAIDVNDLLRDGHAPESVMRVAMDAKKRSHTNPVRYASEKLRDMAGDAPRPEIAAYDDALLNAPAEAAAPPANIRDGLKPREPLRVVDDTS